MKIVALGYKKGSGKNTFSRFLQTYLQQVTPKLKIKEVSFAAKLKDISFQLFNWGGLERGVYYETHREEKEVVLPKLDLSPRDIWIQVGNKLREVKSSVWIDYALLNVQADLIIITDLGYINEAKRIKELDGQLIKIVRDDTVKATDSREIELDSWEYWDWIFTNNNSLSDFNETVEFFGNQLLEEML